MNTLVTGASGFIGSALEARLERNGHRVVTLRRASADSASGPTWNPAARPARLLECGVDFRFPQLDSAFGHLLNQSNQTA